MEAWHNTGKANFERLVNDDGDAGAPLRSLIGRFERRAPRVAKTEDDDLKRVLWAVAEGNEKLRGALRDSKLRPSDVAPPSSSAIVME